jgi:succinate dehydrogenase / fumarate reductase, iron-sulfur subunit
MVTFHVSRIDPAKEEKPRLQAFDFEERPGMTVLEGLIHIQENLDPTLAFRSSCRSALCGSCAMHIGGKYGLACQTQIANVVKPGTGLVIRPLNHLRIIRDLVVDLSQFFAQWKRIRPFLVSSQTESGSGFRQTPAERQRLNTIVDCIMCGSCYAACPSVNQNPDYLGPHALLRSLRWVEDSRDESTADRLDMVADENGVYRCHMAFSCQVVCPKKLDPASAISKLKSKILKQRTTGSKKHG